MSLSQFTHDVLTPYQGKSKFALEYINRFIREYSDMKLKLINIKKDDNLMDEVIKNTTKDYCLFVLRENNPIAIFNDKLKSIPIPYELLFDGVYLFGDEKSYNYFEGKAMYCIALFGYMR